MDAAGIIQEARDLHPAFDDQQAPEKACLRFLSRLQRTLIQRTLALDPFLVTDVLEVDLPVSDFTEGEPLPEAYEYLGVSLHFRDRNRPSEKVVIGDFDLRFHPLQFPTVYVVRRDGQARLFLAGAQPDWTELLGRQLDVLYIPIPADLAAKTDALALPDFAAPTLVEHLGAFMASRSHGRDGRRIDLAPFVARERDGLSLFLDTVSRRRKPQLSVTRAGGF